VHEDADAQVNMADAGAGHLLTQPPNDFGEHLTGEDVLALSQLRDLLVKEVQSPGWGGLREGGEPERGPQVLQLPGSGDREGA
jgi:hypothetical protein